MNNEFYKYIDALSEKKAEIFSLKAKNEIEINTDILQVVKDTSWIEKIESTIPYLDNIIRNPRKFIVTEEDLLPIEKTKKVTEESIKHLAKHTSLIQDVDKDGNVMPQKLLNIFKEETTDLYENRFIHSLVTNTKIFLNDFVENYDISEKSKYQKNINYKSNIKLPGEKISYNLEIKTEYLTNEEENVISDSLLERINKIVEIFDDFLHSQFIKSLNNSVPVRSPIRKTNVILKDQNFIKAVELWEFIEKYNLENSVKTSKISKKEDNYNLETEFLTGAYLQYYAASNVSKRHLNNETYKLGKDYLRNAIEMYVSENHGNEKMFKAMLLNEFRIAKKKRENTYSDIKDIFKDNIKNHEDRMKKSLSYLN